MGGYSKTDWPTDRRSYHKTQTQTQTRLTQRESKKSSGVQSSAWSQEDRGEDSSARKGSTEYQTQKRESLVYVL
jgi:hypothetical protein